jgi:DNA-binding SARP family transcriptional activator
MLDASIETIVGAGEVSLAAEYLARFPPPRPTAGSEIIQSRVAADVLDIRGVVVHAQSAVDLDPSDASLVNLLSAYFIRGDLARARSLAGRLAESAESLTLRQVAAACWHILEVSLDGDFETAIGCLTDLTEHSRRRGHTHYEGVSLLNTALVRRAQGLASETLRCASEALDALSRRSSDDHLLSAQLAYAWANAHMGRLDDARKSLAVARDRSARLSRAEWLLEASEIEISYGDEELAAELLAEASTVEATPSLVASTTLARVQLSIRTGDLATANEFLPKGRPTVPNQEPGHLARYLALASHLSLLEGSPDAMSLVGQAREFSARQGAGLWTGYCEALLAATTWSVGSGPRATRPVEPVYLSLVAEAVADQLHRFDDQSIEFVTAEAQLRPERWRGCIRRVAKDARSPSRDQAARILDKIGVPSDVSLLRAIAKSAKGSRADMMLGRGLARRLADPVTVEDQGRVEVHVGSTVMAGSDLRRKVLAMLCFLLTRPTFSATRDEVVDALWPEMAPEVAVNSLNQTVYFLRRVFEPAYKEDISAGYVRHDSDVVWLERSLIRSRSQQCRDLIDSMGPDPAPEDVERLSNLYFGRFALDFSYEEWAVPFRESLHVAYLQTIERAVTHDIESGHYDRGIRLARRALEIDPNLESLELSLVRLYRVTGAHAAAAEQYAHYAAYVRDELGLEPPPLASL